MTKKCNHIPDISADGLSGKGFLQINNSYPAEREEGWYSFCKKCRQPFLDNKTFMKDFSTLDYAKIKN